MKAQDLRIGDLVQILDEHGDIKTCKVVGIASEKCRNTKTRGFLQGAAKLRPLDLEEDEPSDWYGCWCEGIEPITLTPEILVKNGWSKISDSLYNYVPRCDIFLSLEYVGVGWMVAWDEERIKMREVKYVHELQHLLWWLGLDAELKI